MLLLLIIFMTPTPKPERTMNIVIVLSLVWLVADPNIKFLITKIHLIITGLFLLYKILRK